MKLINGETDYMYELKEDQGRQSNLLVQTALKI